MEEAIAAGEVVAGTILVHFLSASALFDSGASHSFISARFATRVGLVSEPLPVRLSILTGNGIVGVDRVYPSCRVISLRERVTREASRVSYGRL